MNCLNICPLLGHSEAVCPKAALSFSNGVLVVFVKLCVCFSSPLEDLYREAPWNQLLVTLPGQVSLGRVFGAVLREAGFPCADFPQLGWTELGVIPVRHATRSSVPSRLLRMSRS